METQRVSVTVTVAAAAGILGLVAVGLFSTMRVAVLAMAVYVMAGAVARVILPRYRTLAVRRRAVDVGLLVAFAVALTYLGLTTPLD